MQVRMKQKIELSKPSQLMEEEQNLPQQNSQKKQQGMMVEESSESALKAWESRCSSKD